MAHHLQQDPVLCDCSPPAWHTAIVAQVRDAKRPMKMETRAHGIQKDGMTASDQISNAWDLKSL